MIAEITEQLAALLENNIIVVFTLIDFLSKCAILVLLIKYTERTLYPYLTSLHKHKLWMIATILLGILPLSSMLLIPLFGELFSSSNLTFITILVPSGLANNAAVSISEPNNWFNFVYIGYFSVLSYFLIRFAASFRRVLTIKKTSDYHVPQEVLIVFKRLINTLGLQQEVRLGFSLGASSPITFGVRNPIIILPTSIDLNDILLLENVLIHELIHIQRRDWMTHIFGYLIASANWFNPFIWRSLTKLRLEAEFACDDAVLDYGARREDFALHLVKIARNCVDTDTRELLARAAVDGNDLALRVEHILHRDDYALPNKKSFGLLSLMYIPIVFALISVGNIFAIEDETNYATENLTLIHSETPIYPESASDRGIQGYTRYSFTVDENGEVDQATIKLMKSEPNFLFNQSSEEALSGFKFKPRKVNGKHRATSGVTYSFDYLIKI
ncbi:MAG: hypothetical protein COB20_06850 [SAR86 cluster bacterium]|uniref:TonB C-terminal domain-containing protein n=1 Tax=SAR86 cluster bacterium TaxID=2030880 RepID=A0A2A4X6V0_9GAMM|nr:MAG: hypothetical protein COB20_06850 [SAR86 cluster bacterium]